MTELTVVKDFDFDGSAIRTLSDGTGEVWFVAKDVADILGYAETSNMTERLDDDEKRKHILQNGRNHTNQILNKGDYFPLLPVVAVQAAILDCGMAGVGSRQA